MNAFTYIFLFFLVTSIAIQWLLVQRHCQHIRTNRRQVPPDFSDKIPIEAHQKAADYTQAKVKTGLTESAIGNIILLTWTLGGGLQFLDIQVRTLALGEVYMGTIFILLVFLITSILDIPLAWYRTFKLEQAFGFNRMAPRLFCIDIIKNAMLALAIGTPLIMFILWIMSNSGQYWWFYVWLAWLGFSLFMMWAYPEFIAPLFNKFSPLENGELKTRIENLLTRNGFKSHGIFVMNGSTRSTHGNAYFTGLGTNKRIVFFDTLIDELSNDEIEAVLAHELGHFKCKHVIKRITAVASILLIGIGILAWLINESWFYTGLGVKLPSHYTALVLFMLVSPSFTFFMQPVFSAISRKHEFEADDFAADQAQAKNLITALVNLYRENANTLTPDTLYSAFYDSHPPAPIRIAHLRNKAV